MIDLEQIQILAQLIDNLEAVEKRLEKAYKHNNGEEFKRSKKEILDIKDKISKILQ